MMWDGYPSGLHLESMGAFTVAIVLLVVLVASVVSLLLAGRSPRGQDTTQAALPDAQSVLDGRFAAGEIDEDEYLSRTAALQQVGRPGRAG
jgi:putative membrane protein